MRAKAREPGAHMGVWQGDLSEVDRSATPASPRSKAQQRPISCHASPSVARATADGVTRSALKIPRDGTRVFHSLRHNFAIAVRHADIGDRERKQLMGHSRSAVANDVTAEHYDHDDDMARLAPMLARITYTIPNIAPFDVRDGMAVLRQRLAAKAMKARRQPQQGQEADSDT